MSDPATDPFGSSEGLDDTLAAAPAIGSDLEIDERDSDADSEVSADGAADSEVSADAGGSDDAGESAAGSDEAGESEPGADGARPDDAESDAGGPAPDYLGDLQRVSAEFANFRKQTEKRNQELLARATMRLAEALLPVLDACDAAARQGVEGVEPIQAQLLSVLGQEGLEVIADVDEPFDPNRHEAVMTEPAAEDDEAGVVAEVLRTGYSWKGRVFRPAMVKVRG